jgi:hypothetical protein
VHDTDLRSGHPLTQVVAGIERHRHRTARLLDGLDGLDGLGDDLGGAALPERAAAGVQSRTGVNALVSHLAGRLRQADLCLERLAAELGVATPTTSPHQDR